jgi:hypothetical protein
MLAEAVYGATVITDEPLTASAAGIALESTRGQDIIYVGQLVTQAGSKAKFSFVKGH